VPSVGAHLRSEPTGRASPVLSIGRMCEQGPRVVLLEIDFFCRIILLQEHPHLLRNRETAITDPAWASICHASVPFPYLKIVTPRQKWLFDKGRTGLSFRRPRVDHDGSSLRNHSRGFRQAGPELNLSLTRSHLACHRTVWTGCGSNPRLTGMITKMSPPTRAVVP